MAKVIDSLWIFGDCDTQFAKRCGSAGYVGGYINGFTFLPSLFKDFREFKPFFGHSQGLGSDVQNQFARKAFKDFKREKQEISHACTSVQIDSRLQIRSSNFLRPFFIERDDEHIEYIPDTSFKARYLAKLPSLYECDRRSFSLFFRLFGCFKRKRIFKGSAVSDAFTVIQYLKRERFRQEVFLDSNARLGVYKWQGFTSFIRFIVSPYINEYLPEQSLKMLFDKKIFSEETKNRKKPIVYRGKDYTFKHFLHDRLIYLFQRVNKIVNLVENFYKCTYEEYYDFLTAFSYCMDRKYRAEFKQLCSDPKLLDFVSRTHPLAILQSGFSYKDSLFYIEAQKHINEVLQNRIKKKWLNDAHEVFYYKYINHKRKLDGKSDVSFRPPEQGFSRRL